LVSYGMHLVMPSWHLTPRQFPSRDHACLALFGIAVSST
jgi:hypothetical protein